MFSLSVSWETEDFWGGTYDMITCDGYDLTTHMVGYRLRGTHLPSKSFNLPLSLGPFMTCAFPRSRYFAAGMVWMIIGAPLICKMPGVLPDLNDPKTMLNMLKRPSRALTGFVTLTTVRFLSGQSSVTFGDTFHSL